MDKDPLYDEIPERLRTMSEQQLKAEERSAFDALTEVALKYISEPNTQNVETLTASIRLLEVQLALSLKVRDSAVEQQIAREQQRGSTAESIEQMRSMMETDFGKDIDRIHFQLCSEREIFSNFRPRDPWRKLFRNVLGMLGTCIYDSYNFLRRQRLS